MSLDTGRGGVIRENEIVLNASSAQNQNHSSPDGVGVGVDARGSCAWKDSDVRRISGALVRGVGGSSSRSELRNWGSTGAEGGFVDIGKGWTLRRLDADSGFGER